MSQPQKNATSQIARSQTQDACSFDFGLEPGNFFDKDLIDEYACLTEPNLNENDRFRNESVTNDAFAKRKFDSLNVDDQFSSENENHARNDQIMADGGSLARVDLKQGRRLSSWISNEGESTEERFFDNGKDAFLLKSIKRQKFPNDRNFDDNPSKIDFYMRNAKYDDCLEETRCERATIDKSASGSYDWKESKVDEREEMRRKVLMYDENADSFRGGGANVVVEQLKSYSQGLYKSASLPPNMLAQLYNSGSRKTLGGVVRQFQVPVAAATVIRSCYETSAHHSGTKAAQPSAVGEIDDHTSSSTAGYSSATRSLTDNNEDARLKVESSDLISIIEREILQVKSNVSWDDLCGLEQEKAAIKEMVVWPMLRPDLFKGIRAPPRGLLLYGPPGTGKTLIGRCVASQCKATFFNVSASSLTSKWLGESEKLVRTLFQVARSRAPSVIFIDEVDSLMSQRLENEHDSTRRIKNEFLQQLDGTASDSDDRILLIGATNRPQELDTAARRRFARRLFVPLPDCSARFAILKRLLREQNHDLSPEQLERLAASTENYSCADVTNLCKEAALGPLRAVENIETVTNDEISPITYQHFECALSTVRATVSEKDVADMKRFHSDYGYNKV